MHCVVVDKGLSIGGKRKEFQAIISLRVHALLFYLPITKQKDKRKRSTSGLYNPTT